MAKTRTIALCAAAAWLTLGLASADAQFGAPGPKVDEQELQRDHPELYKIAPVSHAYKPKKTAWGDPDLRGMWPVDSFGGLQVQRTPAMGKRIWLSDAEYKAVQARMEASREAPAKETKSGKLGMGNWVEMTGAGRRTSMLIDPDNGMFPEMTPEGKRLSALGRSSWMRNQTYDWVTDFDSWDRCITRGFPASMLPFRYNNGVQILQSPGYVVINLEMIHDARIIPLDGSPTPAGTTNWMGESRGHWEGNTLVVETDHIRPGASPLNMATLGAHFGNTDPMSPKAHVTERFTMIGPDAITYEMTYSDPVYWTAPFTIRVDWTRNQKYKFFEYACHEGDVQVHNYIIANRFERAKAKTEARQKAAEAASVAAPASAAVPAAPANSAS